MHKPSSTYVPSFSPIRYNPNKKVERLYFPQNGDSSLYNSCGRKHFIAETAFKTPYASFSGEELSNNLIRQKLGDHSSVVTSSKPLSYNRQQDMHRLDKGQLLAQRQQYNIVQKEELEQQIENFNVKHQPYKKLQNQGKTAEMQRQNRTKRVRTENTDYYHDQPTYLPKYWPQQISNESVKDRIKTENDSISLNKNKIRFNPTYLSSLNY